MQVLLQPHEEMGIICVQEILERDLEDRGITYALLMWFPWLVAWWGSHGKRWQGHASAKDLSVTIHILSKRWSRFTGRRVATCSFQHAFWTLEFQPSLAACLMQVLREERARRHPQQNLSMIENVSDAPDTSAEQLQTYSGKRRWSRWAFNLRTLTSEVEIEHPVPEDIDQSEFQMLRVYFNLWVQRQAEGDTTGLALDIPSWSVAFFNTWDWTAEALDAFLEAVRVADRDLVDNTCGTVFEEEDGGTALSAPRTTRLFKYGPCPRCGSARRPWIFRSGRNAGTCAFVCNRLFSKTKSRCFEFQAMTSEEVHSMPRFMRSSHSSLRMRFLRAGRQDWQAPGNI